MADPAPLLSLTRPDGARVHVHIDRIIKVTPAAPGPAGEAGSGAASGSTLTVSTGTGTATIDVNEYLLNVGPAELAGFLRLTDLHGMPIKINPIYVIFLRSPDSAGSVLDIHGATDVEVVQVRDSLDSLLDWWSVVASARLTDPNRGW